MWNKSSESGKHSIWCIWLGRNIIRLWLHLVVDTEVILVPSVNVCGDLNALCQTRACTRWVWLQRKFRISKQLWHSWTVNPSFETCFSTEKHTHAALRPSEILRVSGGTRCLCIPYSRFNFSKEYPQSPPLPSPDTLFMWWEKRQAKKFKNLRHVSILLQADETRYRGWCNRCRRTGQPAKRQVRHVEVNWGQ